MSALFIQRPCINTQAPSTLSSSTHTASQRC